MTVQPEIEIAGRKYPVFDTNDVLWTQDQYLAAATDGLERFVRLARPWGYAPELTLPKRLDYVDRAFIKVARHVGGTVVEHTWGVCEDDQQLFRDYPRLDTEGLLPEGWILVAEVATIHECEVPSKATFDAMFNGFRNDEAIQDLIKEQGIPALADYDFEQVVYGYPASKPGSVPTWHYVDIEPNLDAENRYS